MTREVEVAAKVRSSSSSPALNELLSLSFLPVIITAKHSFLFHFTQYNAKGGGGFESNAIFLIKCNIFDAWNLFLHFRQRKKGNNKYKSLKRDNRCCVKRFVHDVILHGKTNFRGKYGSFKRNLNKMLGFSEISLTSSIYFRFISCRLLRPTYFLPRAEHFYVRRDKLVMLTGKFACELQHLSFMRGSEIANLTTCHDIQYQLSENDISKKYFLSRDATATPAFFRRSRDWICSKLRLRPLLLPAERSMRCGRSGMRCGLKSERDNLVRLCASCESWAVFFR